MEQSKFYQIKNVTEHEYTLVGCDDSVITRPIRDIDKTATAFTIADAKDGDVLVASDGSIFLFAGVVDCACKYYAALTPDNYFKINKEAKGGYWETSRAVHPATNEQWDTLFAKMREVGYEWDAEKKELKKISQRMISAEAKEAMYGNPAWSEEDKKKLNRIYMLLAEAADEHAFSTTCRLIGDKECVDLQDFLRSLKPQPKQEWSEEDEKIFNGIILRCKKYGNQEQIDWLKSLRPQKQWKPSEEQMEALDFAANCIVPAEFCVKRKVLKELLEQLKKLREEKL